MANTEYEHAGNADQRRQMQQNNVARCNLCHYPNGYESTSGSITILQLVKLPNDRVALFCQMCIALCHQVGDDSYESASTKIRPLPLENQKANQILIQELLDDAAKTDKEDLTHY